MQAGHACPAADEGEGRKPLHAPGAVAPDFDDAIALGVDGLAGGYTGARLQSRMPEVLIRRLVGVLVIGIGAFPVIRSGLMDQQLAALRAAAAISCLEVHFAVGLDLDVPRSEIVCGVFE